MYILQRVEPLLCNDREISKYTRGTDSVNTFQDQQIRKQEWYGNRGTLFSVVCPGAVATQQRGKHISAATNPDTVIEELCFLLVRVEIL
jgi:hypothetical protein